MRPRPPDIKAYIGTNYTAPRMVFAASGAVEHDMMVDLVGKHFGEVPTEPSGLPFEDSPSLFSGSDLRDFNDEMDAGHFALAFEGRKWTDPDVFTLMPLEPKIEQNFDRVFSSVLVAKLYTILLSNPKEALPAKLA